jgi:hypothetical protein
VGVCDMSQNLETRLGVTDVETRITAETAAELGRASLQSCKHWHCTSSLSHTAGSGCTQVGPGAPGDMDFTFTDRCSALHLLKTRQVRK